MIRRCISVYQPPNHRSQLVSSRSALRRSTVGCSQTDSKWTLTKPSWFGSERASSCQRSTSMKSNCSWTRYRSPRLYRTWAWFSTIQLKMTDHVAALCRSCFFQLRQIRSIRRSLTSDARKTLVNAFVMSRLDYCNSLCHGINEGLLNKLQHIQNAAARLVTDTRKYVHITPVLWDLHWLPIHQRIVFKLATMVYKCQHGLCPSYLAEDCILLSATRGRQHLRSAGRLELLVPRTRTCDIWPAGFHGGRPGSLEFSAPCSKRTDSPRLTVSGGDWKLFCSDSCNCFITPLVCFLH